MRWAGDEEAADGGPVVGLALVGVHVGVEGRGLLVRGPQGQKKVTDQLGLIVARLPPLGPPAGVGPDVEPVRRPALDVRRRERHRRLFLGNDQPGRDAVALDETEDDLSHEALTSGDGWTRPGRRWRAGRWPPASPSGPSSSPP